MPPRGERRAQADEPVPQPYGSAEHNGYDHRQARGADRALRGRDLYWQPDYASRPPRQTSPEPTLGRATVRPTVPGSRRRRKRRSPLIVMLVLLVAGAGVIGVGLRFVPGSPFAPSRQANAAPPGGGGDPAEPAPSPSPTLEPLPFRPADVTAQTVKTKGFLSWAVMDRRTGEIFGSPNFTATSTTASMIKPWIASDYLRRAEENGQTPSSSRMRDLTAMIVDSDNDAAQRTYNAVGGRDSIERLIQICDLTDSKSDSYGWSKTHLSARDTVRMGQCLADGRAAGEKWTPFILEQMRKVRGVGDFGPRNAFPEPVRASIAVKNGWFPREDEDRNWHVGCVAIGDTWVVSVLQRYPITAGWDPDFAHVRQVCQDVTTQLLNPDAT
jgi:hypothetical protein